LTGDVTELTVEVTELSAEAVDVWVDARGDSAAVAAWAGREKNSMTAKIPAAVSAACIATRAMRRTLGCTTSSSPSTSNRAARLPRGDGGKPRVPGLAVRPPPYSRTAIRTRANGRYEGSCLVRLEAASDEFSACR
jgi:hypothetical protein